MNETPGCKRGLAATAIERHLKVQGATNTYDPNYTEYFEKRRSFVWRVRWGGRKATSALAIPA